MHAQKFIASFIDFVNQNFDKNEHLFFVMGNTKKYPVPDNDNIIKIKRGIVSSLFNLLRLSALIQRADKVILHGLFRGKIIILLLLQGWVLKKCYWIIWGKDLYTYKLGKKNLAWKIKEKIRQPVIKNMGNLVTYVKGDVALARKWYGATGVHHECIIYPSNLYSEYPIDHCEHSCINIQVGNSSDPSNEHLEVFKQLSDYKDSNIKIYVPLSYGNKRHRDLVIKVGREMFGENFIPMTNFLPFNEYLKFLSSIDIAIFNHKRQQGMGNAITLLGIGKKVYMRKEVSTWDLFSELGVKVFDVECIDLGKLEESIADMNRAKIKQYFSKDNLRVQLNNIFTS